MPIKKKDFLEIEYTGRLKESNEVFDTTDEKTAKDNDIFSEKSEYIPVIICIGEGHILKGIDEFLEGKEPGNHKVDLTSDKAFGKKTTELIKMVPTSKFSEQKIRPIPGLRLNIDGYVGTVKTVTGGRCVVDFNHPLAGHDVSYEINVKKIITDKKVQIESLLKTLLAVKAPVEVRDKKVKITFPQELPDQLQAELSKKIKDLIGLDTEYIVKKQ